MQREVADMDGADKDRGALGAAPDTSPEAAAGSRGAGAAGSPVPSSGAGAGPGSSGKRSLDSVSREELMVLAQKLNKQLRAANQRADGECGPCKLRFHAPP